VERNSPNLRNALLALLVILAVTFGLLFLSAFLQGNLASTFMNPALWFGQLDAELALDVVSTAAELLAAVLAIAITVVAIIVELAANRYSHRISSLFVKEPVNIVVMSFFVVATVFCVWIALTLDAASSEPLLVNAGLFVSLALLTISLIILLPYFAFVMSFLSPVNVIGKIQNAALRAVRTVTPETVSVSQHNLIAAVDELQDIARRSAELSDRAVEMASINAMFELAVRYQALVPEISAQCAAWFALDRVAIDDPDFVSIDESSVDRIHAEKTWVEVKILRQYLDLVSNSDQGARDASYLIAINTRRLALESLNHRPDQELVNLCMRCFNSYLRSTINKSDARTGYYIMNHYRELAESLLERSALDAVHDIAGHIHFYGLLGFRLGLPFLLEVAAEDVAELAAECRKRDDALLDDLLDLLLNLDQEVREEHQCDSLLGVRRAQIKLAALLLDGEDEARVAKICDDLRNENPARLMQIIQSLKAERRMEYWEFTDRGVNYSFLPAHLRRHLDAVAERAGQMRQSIN
jgi:hypothetical protein